MKLDALAGNQALKERLSAHSRGRGLVHAYLISGPKGIGKHTLAGLLSAAMVCTGGGDRPCGQCTACRKAAGKIHPDIIRVEGEDGKPLTVAQVRAMRADAWIRPNEAERKVYVIEEAHTLRAEAQNAMLKLLEEGPAYAAFLLLAENGAALLPTVRSRCEELPLNPLTRPETEQALRARFPEKDGQELTAAAIRCGGVLGRAVEELSGEAAGDRELRDMAAKLLDTLADGKERERLELAVTIEEWERDRLSLLLDLMRVQVCERLARSAPGAERRRLAGAAGVLERLRAACDFNAAPGHLAGWLAAAFSTL